MAEADIDAVSEIRVRGRRSAYAGIVDDRAGTVGWASLGPYRGETADPRSGEVYALCVRPEPIGTGTRRTLLEAVHDRAAGRFGALPPRVLRDNVRGRRFYGSAGYVADGAEQSDTYGSDDDGEATLTELRYRRAMQKQGQRQRSAPRAPLLTPCGALSAAASPPARPARATPDSPDGPPPRPSSACGR